MPKLSITKNTIFRRPQKVASKRTTKISTASRKDKLVSRMSSEAVNVKYDVMLSKCAIVNKHGQWFVTQADGVVTMWETMGDAITHANG